MAERMRAILIALVLGAVPATASATPGWTHSFGDIPSQSVLAPSIGFSGLPRVEWSFPVSPQLALGPSFAMDLGYYVPERAVDFGLLFGLPFRFSVLNRGSNSAAFRFEPGLGVYVDGHTRMLVATQFGFQFGHAISNEVVIGGGVDVPMGFQLDPFRFVMPILLGPTLEVALSRKFHVFADMKFGPALQANDRFARTDFGMKVAVGAAFAL